MKNEQPQLPFEAVSPQIEPVVVVAERTRPDGIPEEAWILMQNFRHRTAEQKPFSVLDIPAPPEDGSWGKARSDVQQGR